MTERNATNDQRAVVMLMTGHMAQVAEAIAYFRGMLPAVDKAQVDDSDEPQSFEELAEAAILDMRAYAFDEDHARRIVSVRGYEKRLRLLRACLGPTPSHTAEAAGVPVEIIGRTYDGVDVLAPAVSSAKFTQEEAREAVRAAIAREEAMGVPVAWQSRSRVMSHWGPWTEASEAEFVEYRDNPEAYPNEEVRPLYARTASEEPGEVERLTHERDIISEAYSLLTKANERNYNRATAAEADLAETRERLEKVEAEALSSARNAVLSAIYHDERDGDVAYAAILALTGDAQEPSA